MEEVPQISDDNNVQNIPGSELCVYITYVSPCTTNKVLFRVISVMLLQLSVLSTISARRIGMRGAANALIASTMSLAFFFFFLFIISFSRRL